MKNAVQPQIIPACKLNASEHRYTLLSPSDIVFAFVGSAFKRGQINEQRDGSSIFQPHRLYLRTKRGAYFSSSHRSLKGLCDWINSDLFLNIQKSLAVNIQNASVIDFREKQIGLTLSDGSLVWLNISRRYIKNLRERLFFPTINKDAKK